MDASVRQYHLRELEIARSAESKGHLVPKLPAASGRLLDIGCGAGQTMLAMNLNGWTGVGIDIDLEALSLGRELTADSPNLALLLSAAETLPFQNESFDFVLSRVALPYTDIPKVVAEVSRVLRPGGSIWLTLHHRALFNWNGVRSLRSVLYAGYIGINSLLFHSLGRQFRFPLNRRRIESYQTRAGMQRCLERNGLKIFRQLYDSRHFLIEARKQS